MARGVKVCIRNALVAIGAYWLSTWAIAPFGMLFAEITTRIIYGDSILSAILMGVIISLGVSVAAGAAGIGVALVAEGKHSEFWAIIPAVLYAIRHLRSHFAVAPTVWDRVWMHTSRFFPAVVCFSAALLVARLHRVERRQRSA